MQDLMQSYASDLNGKLRDVFAHNELTATAEELSKRNGLSYASRSEAATGIIHGRKLTARGKELEGAAAARG